MRKVIVEAAVYTVTSGVVGLDADQARRRLHKLRPVKGRVDPKTGAGEYEVLEPVQFKNGESFGFSGQIDKDGTLRDPQAEAAARLREAESTEEAVKRAVSAERDRARQEYAKKLEAATQQLEAQIRKEIEPALRKEIEEKVRAELAGAQAGGQGSAKA